MQKQEEISHISRADDLTTNDSTTRQLFELKQFQKVILENQPQESSERLYVYIVPTPIKNLNSAERLTQEQFSMVEVGINGLRLPKSEHDSIQLNEIRHRNKLAAFKKQLIEELDNGCSGNIDQVKETLEKALPYRNITLCPISLAIIGEIADLDNNPELSHLYEALPEHIKGHLKEGNAEALLASDFLEAFGGFFNKSYREHDFILGRLCGITWLHQKCKNIEISEQEIEALIKQVNSEGKKLLDYDPKPSDLKLSQKVRIARIGIVRVVGELMSGTCQQNSTKWASGRLKGFRRNILCFGQELSGLLERRFVFH